MPVPLCKDVELIVGQRGEGVKNRSLYADKYPEFPSDDRDSQSRHRTIARLVSRDFEEGPACGSRRNALRAIPEHLAFTAKLGAHMIVNHAGGVIENAGLALDRHSGVAFIPGSALKGIARCGAALSDAKAEEIAVVFGWVNNRNQEPDFPRALPLKNFAGSVAFLPSYPVGSDSLMPDIVTVHHAKYYQSKDPDAVALDNEQPIPNEFPTVAAGTEYLFILVPAGLGRTERMKVMLGIAHDFDPPAKAREWLLAGITDHGVGAKTAAGYGWFDFDAEAEKQREKEETEARRAAEEQAAKDAVERARLDAMTPVQRETERVAGLDDNAFVQLVNQLEQQEETVQRAVIDSLASTRLSTWKDWRKKKTPKTQKRAEIIEKVAAMRGVALP